MAPDIFFHPPPPHYFPAEWKRVDEEIYVRIPPPPFLPFLDPPIKKSYMRRYKGLEEEEEEEEEEGILVLSTKDAFRMR